MNLNEVKKQTKDYEDLNKDLQTEVIDMFEDQTSSYIYFSLSICVTKTLIEYHIKILEYYRNKK